MRGKTDYEERIEEFFAPGGRLSSVLEGFEFREGQLDMARAVGGSFSRQRSLMVEAGTGTGKTLAYLVPAILSKRRVLVSTGTINLQEQLIEKDIPLVERAMGRAVAAVVLKGRANYLCLRRYERFLRQRSLLDEGGASPAAEITRWASRTRTGDRAELTGLPEGFALWGELSSSSDTCVGAKCTRFEECFVSRARKRAQAADVVVVNHHLFFTDLTAREKGATGVIPRYEALVLDEAHNIERVALAYFSLSVSPLRIEELTRDLLREMTTEKIISRPVERSVMQLMQSSAGFFGALRGSPGDGRTRIDAGFFTKDDAGRGERLTADLALLGESVRASCLDHEPIQAAARRADELADSLTFILEMPDRGYVYWSEVRGGDTTLCAAPIDISRELGPTLLRKAPTVVFTSATLTVNGSFDFFAESVGVGREADRMIFPGGFDLQKNALLYIPSDLSAPRPDNGNRETIDHIGRLLSMSRGRALVLFTSVRNRDAAYAALRNELPLRIMVQGDAPKGALLAEFRDDVASVLFATASFWEGVDIPGEALSLVVVDKLPFDRPNDPLIEARLDYLRDRDQNPFYQYQLPRAVISLRQGLGRLIRSRSDRGVLAVLDSRIRHKRYGRVILESLSCFSITEDLADVEAFFADGQGLKIP